jgi:hypothetical protein
MKFPAILLVVLVSACAAPPPASPDSGVAVVWNRVEDPHATCQGLSGRKTFFNVLGCSHWQEPVAAGAPRTCAIYAPAPRNERDMQRFATLGHELMHCFDGNWHDKWGRMNTPQGSVTASNAQPAPSAAAGGTTRQ